MQWVCSFVRHSFSLRCWLIISRWWGGSSLGLVDAGDAGRGRRVPCWRRVCGAWSGGGHVDLALSLDFIERDAEHLAADEVGDVDVLGSRGRHGDCSVCEVFVDEDKTRLRIVCRYIERKTLIAPIVNVLILPTKPGGSTMPIYHISRPLPPPSPLLPPANPIPTSQTPAPHSKPYPRHARAQSWPQTAAPPLHDDKHSAGLDSAGNKD